MIQFVVDLKFCWLMIRLRLQNVTSNVVGWDRSESESGQRGEPMCDLGVFLNDDLYHISLYQGRASVLSSS